MLASNLGLLLVLIVAASNAVLFKSKFYSIAVASIVETKSASYTHHEKDKSIAEKYYNGTIPEDDGKASFGDLIVDEPSNRKYSWMERNTITNDLYDEDVEIRYKRNFPGVEVASMKVLNFGRQRGFCHSATVRRERGIAEAEILVKAGRMVRILVEVYGVKKSAG